MIIDNRIHDREAVKRLMSNQSLQATADRRDDQFATRLRNSTTQRQARRRSNLRCAAIRSRLWYGEPDAISNAIGYAKSRSRSHDAVIRVYDETGNVIETHEHKGDFKEAS
jgi:hypothetical protein